MSKIKGNLGYQFLFQELCSQWTPDSVGRQARVTSAGRGSSWPEVGGSQ